MKTKKIINYRKLFLELLVVFLGITAGFILNNWRSSRVEKRLELKYLQGFKENISDDIIQLDSLVMKDSIIQSSLLPYIILLRDEGTSMDSAIKYMVLILNIERTSLHSGTYSDIINSGNLNIIQNFTLKTQLSDYEIKKEGLRFIEDHFYEYFNSAVMPFALKEFDLLRNIFNHPDIINTSDFSNVLTGYLSMIQQRQDYAKNLRVESKEVLEILKTELD